MEATGMATQKRGERWNKRRAKKVLAEREACGLSIAAFARMSGLSCQRLYYWHNKLRPKATTESAAPSSPSLSLVPFEVVAEEASAPAGCGAEPQLRRPLLTVRTDAGYAVDVSAGFDGDTLLRVLDVVAEAGRC